MRSYCLRTLFVGIAISCALLSGCTTLTTTLSKKYEVVAYKPKNPDAVRVKVSLQNRMVYVMEGSRPLLVTPTTIGKTGATTPTGTYHVSAKIRKKRSGTTGSWVR